MVCFSLFCFISLFKNAGCDSLKSHDTQFEKSVNNEKIIEQMNKNICVLRHKNIENEKENSEIFGQE